MTRFLILFTLLSAFSLHALAQEASPDAPATKEDVQNYLDAMHSDEMMIQMMDAMANPLHKMVHEQYLKDQDKLPPDFEQRMNKLMDDMLKGMPLKEIMQVTVPTYQKHFTKGELQALTQFYSTPTGQKILKEMPAIMAEAMEAMTPIMIKNMEQMKTSLEQQVAEMLRESRKQNLHKSDVARD
jgi:uncharacterized protein